MNEERDLIQQLSRLSQRRLKGDDKAVILQRIHSTMESHRSRPRLYGVAAALLAVCLVAAGGALSSLRGNGGGARRTQISSIFTPDIHVHISTVAAMPSSYNADIANKNFAVSASAPWSVQETFTHSHAIRRFSILSSTRPEIIYVLPHALVLITAHPDLGELFLNTASGAMTPLWKLTKPVSEPPMPWSAWGGGTIFWSVIAGEQGPTVARGAYDPIHHRPVPWPANFGPGYEDLTRDALFGFDGTTLQQWVHDKTVNLGKVPAQRLDVISQGGWLLTDQPKPKGRVALIWHNMHTKAAATMTVAGNLEAAGADWALVLNGYTLALVVPSRHSVKVVARSVVSPLIANNNIYWVNGRGRVERVQVETNAISAVADPIWP